MKGGKRKNSGRKKLLESLKKKAFCIKLPPWIIQRLNNINASKLILEAIIEKTEWKND